MRVVGAVVVVVFAVLVVTYQFFVLPDLTATRYELTLIGGNEGVTIDVDGDRGVVEVSDAQNGPQRFVISDGRLYLPERVLLPSADDDAWYSFEAADVLDDPQLYGADVLARTLSLGAAECVLPTARANAIVKLGLMQRFDADEDRLQYNVCGEAVTGGAFADGSGVRVQTSRIRPDKVDLPPSDQTTRVEDLGTEGDTLTARARARFALQDP